MTNKLKLCFTALMLGLGIYSAQAQTPPALEQLFRLEGKWQGPAILNLEGNIFNFTYYADFKKNAEGTGMTLDETFSHPELGSLIGYNLIGYNGRDEKIHWFSVDNFGTCHDHLGWWKSANHFYMEATEKQGGKKFEEFIDFVFINDSKIELTLIAKLGGHVIQEITVTFFKQP